MKSKIYPIGIIFLVLSYFGFISNLNAQENKPTSPTLYKYVGKITFMDGTPVKSINSEIEQIIDLRETEKNNSYLGYVTGISNGSISLLCQAAGKYSISFSDHEIIRFEVHEQAGKLQSDLPDVIQLPFNYIVKTLPNYPVSIYTRQGTLFKTEKTDKNGYLFISEDTSVTADKFIACNFENEFPQLRPFPDLQSKFSNKIQARILHFSPTKKEVKVQGGYSFSYERNTVVHNINDDVFYKVVHFPLAKKEDELCWLLSYNAKSKKGAFHRLDFPESYEDIKTTLFLDEEGKVMVVLAYHDNKTYESNVFSFVVDQTGHLNPVKNIIPNYRFKGNYFQGSKWIIPTFNGIALKEGSHDFTVSCKGSWSVPNPAYENWHKRWNKLQDKKYHSNPPVSSKQINDEIKALGPEPTTAGTLTEGSKTSTQSVRVVFAPQEKYLWKFKDEQHDDSVYTPSITDPESEIFKIDINECFLSVDGSQKMGYSYIDPMAGKSVFYTDYDSEEERAKATEIAVKNANRYIGFGEDSNPWGKMFNLFVDSVTVEGPLNMLEGPYPELRYRVGKSLGEYTNLQEAKKHCDKPERYYSKYRCFEYSTVSVCPENYRFSVENNQIITNYDALYCGKVTEEDNNRGDKIVAIFSKKGYITKTRTLNKRTLEAGEILLSGHITDKSGVEIEGATIKLRGIDGSATTDDAGIYNLIAKSQGSEAYSQVMDIKLQKIQLEISNEDLGVYKEGESFGVVSDGFTTLKMKVKAKGIDPRTVIVKQPKLGQFVEQGFLKIPLDLDANGEGEMEYVPPKYLKMDELTKHVQLKTDPHNQYATSNQLWAAEVPVEITYEDDEGNPGGLTLNILVCRPPVMLVHGFTGDEMTWQKLAVQLRRDKFDAIVREYYRGVASESSIQDQSKKLGFYIQKLREAYLKDGILQTRVDIVAHSMGGLISRYYISNLSKYGEKAGIVIPYNVKLSREELAAARFQKPVKLIDVRKLIMVGTPNHGASLIDERIGALSALGSDYHQIANEQLRYDSPFFSELNAGESEGRHLDPNVQYALIHGTRRRSKLYPPDLVWHPLQTASRKLASGEGDGVVSTSSALLNGVKDYPFPEKGKDSIGYIHSPAVELIFYGDAAITEDEEIFKKIHELLLDDIPRMPLANSYSKIIAAEGDASMRYFSTRSWKPISGLSSKKLTDPWCHIKTEEGSTSLGFFLNGHHWGTLHVQPNSIVYCESATPEFVKVYLQQGKARFQSRKQGGGGFEVVMGDEGEKWYAFNPRAKVTDLNTDFIVEAGDTTKVYSINGNVELGVAEENGKKINSKKITKNDGVLIDKTGAISDNPLPKNGWWSNIDTAYVKDEVVDIQNDSTNTTAKLSRQNLLVNGGFEEGPEIDSHLTLKMGDTIRGWMISQENVDLVGTYFKNYEGHKSIDLYGSPGIGAIEQTLSTTVGKIYAVSFAMAGNPDGNPIIKKLQLSAAGQNAEFEFDISGKSRTDLGWQIKHWKFTATDEQTTLKFASINQGNAALCGPCIDDVKVFEIDTSEIQEENIPILTLGTVEVKMGNDYLPISGFTSLQISAKDDRSEPMRSPYSVKISLENEEQFPFINVTNPTGTIDTTGTYTTNVTIQEPSLTDFTSIKDVPLQATFVVQLFNPQTEEMQFEKKLLVPLGMTLLYGQTIGPDYQPRQQPVPPEFYGTSYQIANETDTDGNLFILFNSTLFNKNIEKFKERAKRTQTIFSMDQFNFSIQWANACSLPLKYALSDSLKHQLVAGQKVQIGKNGLIDLLTPVENEQRVKQMMQKFVDNMPLLPEEKAALFSKIDHLTFKYDVAQITAPYFNNEKNEPEIEIAQNANEFWGSEFTQEDNDPTYLLLFHAMGHLINQTICTSQRRYKFLAAKCTGSENLWEQAKNQQQQLFDRSKYISFNEAGADFFAYLLYHFVENTGNGFAKNSIYFNKGYLNQFSEHQIENHDLKKFLSNSISGMQTTFLINYYGSLCNESPDKVYSDFLLTRMLYSNYTESYDPAMTMSEWLLEKQSTFEKDELVRSINPMPLAVKYELKVNSDKVCIIPQQPFDSLKVIVDGKSIPDFNRVPKLTIEPETEFEVVSGNIEVLVTNEGEGQLLEVSSGSKIKIGENYRIELLKGNFHFKSPIIFETSLVKIAPASSNFTVKIEPEETTFSVFEGEMGILSIKDYRLIEAGETTTMNKKGNIKKPKKIKNAIAPASFKNIEIPFLIGNTSYHNE